MFGSLRSFVKARPPYVAFTLSLIVMTISLFIVALYMKYSDVIVDLRSEEDWNTFVQLLNSQELCIDVSDSKQPPNSKQMSAPQSSNAMTNSQEIFIPIKISNITANHLLWMKLQEIHQPASFVGHITLKGWKPSCQSHQIIPSHEGDGALPITLSIPSGMFSKSTMEVPSCVFVNGHFPFLPSKIKTLTSEQCHNLNASAYMLGRISPYSVPQQSLTPQDTVNGNVCGHESVIEFSYDPENSDPPVYLTEGEKLQLVSHILVVGYFLIGVVSILVLIAVIQGRYIMISGQHMLLVDKDPL